MGSVGKDLEDKLYSTLGIDREKENGSYKYVGRLSEISDEIKQLNGELKDNQTVKPKKDWDTNDELLDLLGEKPMSYTPRGNEILKRLDELYKERDTVQSKMDELNNETARIDNEHYQRELIVWANNTPKLQPITTQNYKGFSLDTKTGSIESAVERGDAVIVEMSPKEYLQRISYDVFKTSLQGGLRGVSISSIKKYATEMKSGTKYDMPWIDYKNGGQEGRHRALAAILNGYKKIPVAVRLK